MTQVNFRIDSDVKREADELFANLGLSLSAAITIFLRQAISHRGLPFAVCENRQPVSHVPRFPPAASGGRRAALQALADNPKLLKTPIVRNGSKATVGDRPEIWATWE